jgi:hypothetical protein
VVPLAALVREGEAAFVWVVDPKSSRVQRRDVRLGRVREDGAIHRPGWPPGTSW